MLRPAALAVALLCVLSTFAGAQEASDLLVRLNRLEGQVRQLAGQVEQLQFDNRQLREQARKFQEDVEFRFQERGGARPAAPSAGATPATPAAPARPVRRGDAFDPATEPGAPGAPRPLGVAPSGGGVRRDSSFTEGEGDPSPAARGAASGGPVAGLNPSSVAGLNPAAAGGPDAAGGEYEAAYASFQARQYETSEAGFRRFVQAHPKDRRAGDATYFLGESFLQRARHREAAEQFLRVTTEYGRSPRAADALFKLGVSLAALGARDQACATFAEVERKYPSASAGLKQNVDREQKRGKCG